MTSRIHSLPCKRCPSSDGVTQYLDNGMFKCFACGRFWWDENDKDFKKQAMSQKPEKFPDDYTHEIPEEYKSWFTQYDIDPSFGSFGWSEKYQMIIINLGNNKWIGRGVHKKQRKYHYPRGQGWSPYALDKWYTSCNNNKLILTEDVLSACKVYLSLNRLHSVYAILGTYQPKIIPIIEELNPKEIIIWLDGDAAGVFGAKKLFNALSFKYKCRIIETSKDPKCYSPEDIQRIINEE